MIIDTEKLRKDLADYNEDTKGTADQINYKGFLDIIDGLEHVIPILSYYFNVRDIKNFVKPDIVKDKKFN